MIDLANTFAGIAALATSTFGGPYVPARIVRYEAPVTDDGGSILAPARPNSRACLAQVDAMTEAMRAQPGFAERDLRILILRASLGSDPAIGTDDRLRIMAGPDAGSYAIHSVAADPAGIGWEIRGRPV